MSKSFPISSNGIHNKITCSLGYAFLLYKDEISVQRLIDMCIMQDGKLYLCVSSPTIKDKPVCLSLLLEFSLTFSGDCKIHPNWIPDNHHISVKFHHYFFRALGFYSGRFIRS